MITPPTWAVYYFYTNNKKGDSLMEKILNMFETLVVCALDHLVPMTKVSETPVLIDCVNGKPVYKFTEWYSGTVVMAHHSMAWFRVNVEEE